MLDLELYPLLDYLAQSSPETDHDRQNWHIAPITGGRNNRLYRVTDSEADIVVKFSQRDGRDRAGREYGALLALWQAGLRIAPQPLLLERTRYPQPLIVQTWLAGNVSDTPPATDNEWRALLQHLATIHTLTPDKVRHPLTDAVLSPRTAEACKQLTRDQCAHIPGEVQPKTLPDFVARLEATSFPDFSDTPITLCRTDPNILNFIRRPHLWASVDWEYSGWGDPAFDLADLFAHAAYIGVPESRWEWCMDVYCDLAKGAKVAQRVRTYYGILLVWWLARLARYLYEIPRGLDPRLVNWSEGWEDDIRAKYEHYLGRADRFYTSI